MRLNRLIYYRVLIFCSNLSAISFSSFEPIFGLSMPFGGRKLLGRMGKFQNVIYPFPDGATVGYELLDYPSSISWRDGYPAHESGCSFPRDVPKGCLAVYVGRERHRFVVPTEHLHHHLFKSLLEKSAKEFGFEYSGGLIIPCEVQLFQRLLWLIEHNHPAAQKLDLDQLLNNYKIGSPKASRGCTPESSH